MKIKLFSDYRDYYDHWFESPHSDCEREYHRFATGWLGKSKQFSELSKSWAVPQHGLVSRLNAENSDWVVVYTDELSHRGEGKRLMTLSEARQQLSLRNCLCSRFIHTTESPLHAISKRLLCIGSRLFWLTYESKGDWRSNYGPDVEVKNVVETLSKKDYLAEAGPGECDFAFLDLFPLWAVDFVKPYRRNQLLAIDLNTAPGLRHTGIEDLIPAKGVFKEIQAWFVGKGLVEPQARLND